MEKHVKKLTSLQFKDFAVDFFENYVLPTCNFVVEKAQPYILKSIEYVKEAWKSTVNFWNTNTTCIRVRTTVISYYKRIVSS